MTDHPERRKRRFRIGRRAQVFTKAFRVAISVASTTSRRGIVSGSVRLVLWDAEVEVDLNTTEARAPARVYGCGQNGADDRSAIDLKMQTGPALEGAGTSFPASPVPRTARMKPAGPATFPIPHPGWVRRRKPMPRKTGPAVWVYRWRETDEHGERCLRKKIIGTAQQFPNKAQASAVHRSA